MTLARLANYAALTGDNFVVGRQLGAAALGLYGRAYQLMMLPTSEFSDVVTSVLFPAYAEIQHQPERLRRAFLASVSVSTLCVLPLLVTLATSAPELVIGVFGAQWAGAVLPFQVLCLGGCFRSVYTLGDSVARACGAVYSQSWRHALYAACVIAAAVVGSNWGISGVAGGVVGALAVMYLLMAQLSLRLTGASCQAFIAAQVPGVLVALGVAGLGIPIITLMRSAYLPHLVVLGGTLVVSLLTAGAVALLLPRHWHDRAVVSALQSAQQRLAASALCLRVRCPCESVPLMSIATGYQEKEGKPPC